MSLENAIRILKAAGDATRLRLLALLSNGEATVGELQQILGQSQPRVSRHLRLLGEAALVTKFRDGQWVYYRLASGAAERDFAAQIVGLAGADDLTLAADAAALANVKRARERDVYASAGRHPFGSGFSVARPDARELAAALDDALGDGPLGDVLDIGSGAGSLLCMLGSRARQVVGVDASKRMRLLARSRVHQSGITNCTVRDGELTGLPFGDASFDLVVLDEVLGSAADPRAGLREAIRVLRRDGRLVIVDRIQPVARKLTTARGVLVENQLTTQLSELGYRVTTRNWLPGRVMEYALLLAVPAAQQKRTGTDA